MERTIMRTIEVVMKINDNSNNNDLNDGQNDRLDKKEIFIRKRNWSGLYAFEKYKHCMENNLEQQPGDGPLSQEWIDEKD